MTADPILLAVDGLQVGGTERQIVELIKGLKQSGRQRIVLAVLDRGGELEAEAAAHAARVLSLRRRARFDGTPAALLLWQARQAGIRLIHAVGRMSALAGLPVARCLGVPIINGSIRAAPGPLQWRDRLSRWCAVRSDWIVANSRAGLIAHGLGDHPRAQVIANGIDLARFAGVVAADADGPTICMVANFSPRKHHAAVIRALPLIQRLIPDVRLTLVGGDFGTLAGSRQLAQRVGVAAAVRFVTDTARPEPFIAASQVCVLASVSESFSNAILEYMALGKPVVATDTCGDSAALIGDGACGFLVPRDSPEALAARLLELLRDPLRAQAMGEVGRQRVQAFSMARMVAEYEALFEQLLTAGPRRRGAPLG
ncbi:MAG: glycosyltransferase family 4 protein [bacterium]